VSSAETMRIYNKRIGPFYTEADTATYLKVTVAELRALADARAVLGVTVKDGNTLYPSFQFGDDAGLLPHLASFSALIAKRTDNTDTWGLAIRLNAPIGEWGGRTAAELLRTEHAKEVLLQTGEGASRALDDRARTAGLMAVARLILDRIISLTEPLPITIVPGTLFVTRQTAEPYGVFAVTIHKSDRDLCVGRFPIDGDREQIAQNVAAYLTDRVG